MLTRHVTCHTRGTSAQQHTATCDTHWLAHGPRQSTEAKLGNNLIATWRTGWRGRRSALGRGGDEGHGGRRRHGCDSGRRTSRGARTSVEILDERQSGVASASGGDAATHGGYTREGSRGGEGRKVCESLIAHTLMSQGFLEYTDGGYKNEHALDYSCRVQQRGGKMRRRHWSLWHSRGATC